MRSRTIRRVSHAAPSIPAPLTDATEPFSESMLLAVASPTHYPSVDRPHANASPVTGRIMKRALRIAALFTIVLPSALAAQHGASASARPALAPAKEASQFDFLIGQWELVVTPKVNTLAAKIHGAPKLLGTWKAWRAADGFAIEDELRIMDRSGNPNALAKTLRVYSANERRWVITGVDAYRGRASSASGEWKGAEMVIIGQGTDEEGKPYQTRTRYFDITPTSFRYQQDRSPDGGKTWDEAMVKIAAKRVAAAAPR
jgi:hypothetical protein